MEKIRVLIVDDSLVFREMLAAGLEKDDAIEVVGKAENPFVARDMIIAVKPDVMTLDLEMPKMSGLEFIKRLLPQYPLPTVVISSSEEKVIESISAGAVDFVAKPKPGDDKDRFIRDLINKIKIASIAKVTLKESNRKSIVLPDVKQKLINNNAKKLIAIGSSTGGTEALSYLLQRLPADMPPILIVQHMPAGFTKMFATRLNNESDLQVKEAQDLDLVKPGCVYVAPGDFHMKIIKTQGQYKISCFRGEKVNGHCPSVEVLFKSVAELIKKDAVGIILTGMGKDGATGLLDMKKEGAYTIGQDEASSVVYGMPRVAFNIGAVKKQLPLEKIPEELCRFLRG